MHQQTLLKNNRNQLFPSAINTKIVTVFSSRHDKNMSLNYGQTENSLANRRDFMEGLGIDCRSLVCAKQVHGCHIEYADLKDAGRGAVSQESAFDNTDALITDKKNVPLVIFTADCLPVFLFAPRINAIGLIHAGRRSTRENIAVKTIQFMQEKFSCDAKEFYASFGPAIRSCCYEVGHDLKNEFPENYLEKNARYYLDLIRINREQILSSGVKEKNIYDSGICTSCRNSDFFSYRKEGSGCGRMVSLIMLK